MKDSQTVRTDQLDSTEQDSYRVQDNLIGKVLGGCHILEHIAHGNMGAVYKAEHLSLKRLVAIKILPQSLINKDSQHIERFKREAINVGQLDHPNIVTVYNVGYGNIADQSNCGSESSDENGYYFIEMQFIEGSNLRDIIRRKGAIAVKEAIDIAKQIASGMAAAHKHGIIHRDIKPSNIMITSEGVAKIVDFGLAKCVHSRGDLTSSDCVIGTPYYMAPEQWNGVSCDHRTDIYGLGATFYYMVTGVRPYPGETPLALMVQHCKSELRSPKERNPSLPNIVCDVIAKMMAKDPHDRYQTVEELIAELNEAESRMASTMVDGSPYTHGAQENSPRSSLWRQVINRLLLPVGVVISACVIIIAASSIIPGLAQKQNGKGDTVQGSSKIEVERLGIEKRKVALEEDKLAFKKEERHKQNIDKLEDKLDSAISRIQMQEQQTGTNTAMDTWTSRPLTITLLNFEHKGSQPQDRLSIEQLSARIKGLLQKEARFNVVERQTENLENILREQKLSLSKLADKSSAIKTGKVRLARLNAIGTTAWTKIGLLITIKVIDTETTEEVVTISNANAINASLEETARSMASAIISAVKSRYPIHGRIANLDGRMVTLNVGSDQGVTKGMRMKVIADGNVTQQVGKIEIVSVGKSTSEGNVLDGQGRISVGLKVEEIYTGH